METTHKYWDCECIDNYIHPMKQADCKKCGSHACYQPDSRVNEVEVMLQTRGDAAPDNNLVWKALNQFVGGIPAGEMNVIFGQKQPRYVHYGDVWQQLDVKKDR